MIEMSLFVNGQPLKVIKSTFALELRTAPRRWDQGVHSNCRLPSMRRLVVAMADTAFGINKDCASGAQSGIKSKRTITW